MVYTVDRDLRYQVFKSERDTVRKSLQNKDCRLSSKGLLTLYRYMINNAGCMSYLEEQEWEAQD